MFVKTIAAMPIALLLATRGALAQFKVSSASESSQDLVQCKAHTLRWLGGTPPFHLVLDDGNELIHVTETSEQTIEFVVSIAEGSTVGYMIMDADGQQLFYPMQVVQPGADSSCLEGSAPSTLPSTTSEPLTFSSSSQPTSETSTITSSTFSITSTSIPVSTSTTSTSAAAETTAEPLPSLTSPQSSVVESSTPEKPKRKSSIAAIIGGIFGGLFLAFLVVFALIFSLRRSRREAAHHHVETGYGGKSSANFYTQYTDSKKSDSIVPRPDTLITSDRGIVILEPPVELNQHSAYYCQRHKKSLSTELFVEGTPRPSIASASVPLSRTRKEIYECHSRGNSSSSIGTTSGAGLRLRAGSIYGTHSKNSSSSSLGPVPPTPPGLDNNKEEECEMDVVSVSRTSSREYSPPPRLTFTPPLDPSRYHRSSRGPNPPPQVYIRERPIVADVRESRHGTSMDHHTSLPNAPSSRSSPPVPGNDKIDSLQHLVDRLGAEIRTAAGTSHHQREVSEVDVMAALSTMKQLGRRLSIEKSRGGDGSGMGSPVMEYGFPPPTYLG